jgi:hypothetical protein
MRNSKKQPRAIQNKRRGMLTYGIVLLRDNAHPLTAVRTPALLEHFNWELFDHPPYSPDFIDFVQRNYIDQVGDEIIVQRSYTLSKLISLCCSDGYIKWCFMLNVLLRNLCLIACSKVSIHDRSCPVYASHRSVAYLCGYYMYHSL